MWYPYSDGKYYKITQAMSEEQQEAVRSFTKEWNYNHNMGELTYWPASLPGTILLFYIIMSISSYHETGEFFSIISLIIIMSFSLILFIYFKKKKNKMIETYDNALIDFIATISKTPQKS
jgi:LPXTG-motif cell wall-anchored protein